MPFYIDIGIHRIKSQRMLQNRSETKDREATKFEIPIVRAIALQIFYFAIFATRIRIDGSRFYESRVIRVYLFGIINIPFNLRRKFARCYRINGLFIHLRSDDRRHGHL